ncbi:hypothetical protein DSO57_1021116 [Entomophthora muscae]|uniref:Uncharacterized protein n=1 Tax=Entomophthora muscae TaxID=34485 RepID=A0ACC2UQK6_9FUNG|nr:hypothetical protein DSO57_1021116 [Entomophthora muscae]
MNPVVFAPQAFSSAVIQRMAVPRAGTSSSLAELAHPYLYNPSISDKIHVPASIPCSLWSHQKAAAVPLPGMVRGIQAVS